jgi:FKBP-type peptidyl-prolyl cis-trans isomerase
VVFVSCRSRDEQREKNISPGQLEESLLEANKQAVLYEDRQIDDYIRRQDWKMQKTGTGLRYMIYEAGKGSKAEIGSIAELEYTVQLINGDQIYSSDIGGIKKFLIGKGGVEAGLEEGILLLREGDRAKFIIPSHLAFGLAGDRDKIPPKATLIYDVKLLKIKR